MADTSYRSIGRMPWSIFTCASGAVPADADGRGDLSPTEAERAGVSQHVLRGSPARPAGPVAAAGELTTDTAYRIPPTPPRERLRQRSRGTRLARPSPVDV